MTLTPYADRLAVGMSLLVLMTNVCRGLDSKTKPSAREVNTQTECVIAGASKYGSSESRALIFDCWLFVRFILHSIL